jgi:hypothetical protein
LEAVGDVSGSLASQILKATSTSWQFISLRFTTGPSDSTTTVKIYLSGQNGNATAYVDLVSLKKADTAYTYDYSPYGNDGAIATGAAQAPAFTAGKAGQAMQFDGVDDYVDCGNDASLDISGTKDFTWELWAKKNEEDRHEYFIIKGTDWASLGTHSAYDPDRLFTEFRQADGAFVLKHWTSTPAPGTTDWHHYVLVHTGTKFLLYMDGVNYQEWDLGQGLYDSSAQSLQIGGGRFFKGLIDEVRIYNRALSAEEIRAHYLRGVGAHGLVQADKFRVLDTDNTVNFQIDGSGNTTFTGNLTVSGTGTTTFAGPIEITSATTPQLKIASSTFNYFTLTIDNAASTLYATDALNITATATSTWKTTAGALTIQSADTLTATSTGAMIFGTAGTERMRILTDGNVGIATSTPVYTLHVWGSLGVGTSTTPVLYVDPSTELVLPQVHLRKP